MSDAEERNLEKGAAKGGPLDLAQWEHVKRRSTTPIYVSEEIGHVNPYSQEDLARILATHTFQRLLTDGRLTHDRATLIIRDSLAARLRYVGGSGNITNPFLAPGPTLIESTAFVSGAEVDLATRHPAFVGSVSAKRIQDDTITFGGRPERLPPSIVDFLKEGFETNRLCPWDEYNDHCRVLYAISVW